MNIKSYSGVIASVVASTVLAVPAQAANVQVQGLEVRPGNGGLELELNFTDNDGDILSPPSVSTTQRDRTLITEIANANLDLANGQKIFTQDNPLPGIERLEVTEPTPGNVRIVALGSEGAPTGELLSQDGDSILLNVAAIAPTETAQTSQPQVTTRIIEPPMLAQNNSNNQNNNLLQPTSPVPPFLPRASAPPVGDISVSTIDSTAGNYVNLQTNAVVPRLVLKDAPIEDVMSLLARSSGLNIVVGGDVRTVTEGELPPVVTLDMENAPVQDVFNYVLMLGNLNAVRNGNTIFVGRQLPYAVAPRITRSFRLNQATPEEARCFLLTGDSSVSEVINESRETETSEAAFSLDAEGSSVPTSRTQSTAISREVERTCARTPTEAEVARGLISRFSTLDILTDARLNALTLSGDPRTIEMASNFLQQLDARRRQVAVNVKVIDVTLEGNRSISSDIKLLLEDRIGISAGDGIIISPNDLSRTSSIFGEFNPDSIVVERGNENVSLGSQLDVFDALESGAARVIEDASGQIIAEYINDDGTIRRLGLGTITNPVARGTNFVGSLVAGLLRNTTSKIIADPTLVIQESQTGELRITEQIINSVNVEVVNNNNQNGNPTFLATPELAEVGLIVPVTVENIDDNGFITLNITSEVSTVGDEQEFESGVGINNTLRLKRQSVLNSGSVRLRDDQTLILAGAIDERDIVTTSKVPILGDIPILGSLFRSTSRENSRRELLFIITPQIIDDSQDAMWGYGYQPSETAQQMLENNRFPTR
ncbi:general secretion pathway protein D [[Synechococcus] sp. NIES-970]|nr:general secretion pathway protein D [[Synechococcus] sp. NIES-970]